MFSISRNTIFSQNCITCPKRDYFLKIFRNLTRGRHQWSNLVPDKQIALPTGRRNVFVGNGDGLTLAPGFENFEMSRRVAREVFLDRSRRGDSNEYFFIVQRLLDRGKVETGSWDPASASEAGPGVGGWWLQSSEAWPGGGWVGSSREHLYKKNAC